MFTLDKNRKRVQECPCGKSNKDGKFIPFVGFNNKGYCHACGKTFYPDSAEKGNSYISASEHNRLINFAIRKDKGIDFIPKEVFISTLKSYEKNHFVNFLISRFGIQITQNILKNYFIGTSKRWPGATIFWQCDINRKIRTGKIMLYNPVNGKRIKEPYNHFDWAHRKIGIKDYNLVQCFFGEHQLIDNRKPIIVVESEKTAIIASIYHPDFLWLATGGINGSKWSSPEVFHVLKGYNVVLCPDLQAEKEWNIKLDILRKHGINASLSNWLELKSTETERKEKIDIADILLKRQPSHYITGNTTLPP